MYWLLFFVYAFIFGFLSSLAVKEKNRDQFNWFLIGFFLGIFGWITALAISKVENKSIVRDKENYEVESISIICPKCKTEFNFKLKYCTNCGERLTNICSNCTSTSPIDAKFCVQCGTKL